MPHEINRLSVAAANAKTEPGLYADGGGLYLQVAKGGSKSWIFRFMLNGRARKMGLGSFRTYTLAEARKRAKEQRQKLDEADDPIELRKAAKMAKRAADTKALSFEEATEQYIKAHRASWKNLKHADQWEATLKTYAYPVFGKLVVSSVDTALVMKVLEPIWYTKSETASRVRGRVEKILDAAKVQGLRSGENPARWKGHLDKLLPARGKVAKVNKQPSLPYGEVGSFIRHLRETDGTSARALEFVILTATRTNEVISAKWHEIDLDAGMWIIPESRMKAGKEHRVSLSGRALEILKALPREKGNPYVFIGDRKGRPLSDMALAMTLRRMHAAEVKAGRKGYVDPKQLDEKGNPKIAVPHGFRSTFRDWSAEQTAYPSELVEMALAHAIKNKVEAAYRRGDMLEKRRRLMDDWAAFCGTLKDTAAADNVTPIRRQG